MSESHSKSSRVFVPRTVTSKYLSLHYRLLRAHIVCVHRRSVRLAVLYDRSLCSTWQAYNMPPLCVMALRALDCPHLCLIRIRLDGILLVSIEILCIDSLPSYTDSPIHRVKYQNYDEKK